MPHMKGSPTTTMLRDEVMSTWFRFSIPIENTVPMRMTTTPPETRPERCGGGGGGYAMRHKVSSFAFCFNVHEPLAASLKYAYSAWK